MKKLVYLIPGFNQQVSDANYTGIKKIFSDNGFRIMSVTIDRKRRVMTDYVEQFMNQFRPNAKEENYLFGFSFGAMISFIASTKISLSGQFLASLSPYFAEDLNHIPQWWKKHLGHRRVDDFKSINCRSLAPLIDCQTYLFAGDKEPPEVAKRAQAVNRLTANSVLHIIPGAKHDIAQDEYVSTLHAVIKTVS